MGMGWVGRGLGVGGGRGRGCRFVGGGARMG